MKKIEYNGDTYQLDVDSKHQPTIERILTGTTSYDTYVHNLPIPKEPLVIKLIINILRWYRRNISTKLGNRCVFEPSCSHYSELAFRKYGIAKGFFITTKRLFRCRPGNGGIDIP